MTGCLSCCYVTEEREMKRGSLRGTLATKLRLWTAKYGFSCTEIATITVALALRYKPSGDKNCSRDEYETLASPARRKKAQPLCGPCGVKGRSNVCACELANSDF